MLAALVAAGCHRRPLVAGAPDASGAGGTGASGMGGVDASTPGGAAAAGGAKANPTADATPDETIDATIDSVVPGPGGFTLTSPVDDPNAEAAAVFAWTPSAGAVSYEVELSTSAKFEPSATQRLPAVTLPGARATTAFPPGRINFWRVTAVGADGGRTQASNGPAWFSVPVSGMLGPFGIAVTSRGKIVVAHVDAPIGLSILDGETFEGPLVETMGSEARYVAVTGDGRTAFVSQLDLNPLAVVDLEGASLVGFSDVGAITDLFGIAVSPNDDALVFPGFVESSHENVLQVQPLPLPSTLRSIHLGTTQEPYNVTMVPGDGSALVDVGGVTRVDLATGALTTIAAGVYGMAVTADSKTAWGTEGAMGGVREIDLVHNVAGRLIPFEANQDFCNIAVTPDGERAVVTSFFRIGVLDLVAGTVLTTFPLPAHCVAISSDGLRAFVTGAPKGLYVIWLGGT